MVVHGHGQHLFGTVLPNHVLVHIRLDFFRPGRFPQFGRGLFALIALQFIYVLGSQTCTVTAYKAVKPLQQERHFLVRAAAEHTMLLMSFLSH